MSGGAHELAVAPAGPGDAARVARGLELARRRTRTGSRSFYLASFLLDGERRAAAYALYSFLRAADDAADDPGSATARMARIARSRASLARVYAGAPEGELEAALAWATARFAIPREPLDALLAAVVGDVARVRIPTWAALEAYCQGVAGTVGLAMAPLLGAPVESAGEAAALGRAMQLTNVLRDVAEDLAQDRVYLPAEALAAEGLTEDELRTGRVDARFRRVAAEVAARAHAEYAAAERGVRAIAPRRSRATVRVMRAVYREILVELERRDFDVFRGRVVVSTPRKLWLVARVLGGMDPVGRAPARRREIAAEAQS